MSEKNRVVFKFDGGSHEPVAPKLPSGSELAAPSGWTAKQQLEILCETLRNIANGTKHLHGGNFGHAALDLEVAAGKLRLLERCRQSNNKLTHGATQWP